jgi:hypothetical protein
MITFILPATRWLDNPRERAVHRLIGRCIATICPITSSDAGNLCSILFPMPASQGRTHLRTSADCTACLCRSLTGWTLHDATTLSDRAH